MSKYDLDLFELKMMNDKALGKLITLEADIRQELERVTLLKEGLERNIRSIDELQRIRVSGEKLQEHLARMRTEHELLRAQFDQQLPRVHESSGNHTEL